MVNSKRQPRQSKKSTPTTKRPAEDQPAGPLVIQEAPAVAPQVPANELDARKPRVRAASNNPASKKPAKTAAKTAGKKKPAPRKPYAPRAKKSEDQMSISRIADKYEMDRRTVSKKLRGIEPIKSTAREKVYQITPELIAALLDDPELEKLKKRKLEREGDILDLKYQQAVGEMVSIAEVTERLVLIFGGLHKRLFSRLPRKIAGKLLRAGNLQAVEQILRTAIGKEFDELRQDHTDFFRRD